MKTMCNFLRFRYGDFLSVVRAVFLYPRNSLVLNESQDYDAYWKRKRGRQLGQLSVWQKARADIIASVLKHNPGSVADIGCGDGSILLYLKESVRGMTTLTGYDTSRVALDVLSKNNVRGVHLDLADRGWHRLLDEADYILLLETIEHVANAEEVVSLALEKANKGVFLSVPNTGFYTYRLRLLFGSFPVQWLNFPNEHVRFWTARDMKWWLRALGYSHAKVYLYRGVPMLNRIWPSLFAAGQVIYIPKQPK